MRTVTFSDPAIVRAVQSTFVSTWVNRVPGFHDCEFGTEDRIAATATDCFPTKNFCVYFCTPDRQVLNYLTGYFSPKVFLPELEYARRLLIEAVDENGQVKGE